MKRLNIYRVNFHILHLMIVRWKTSISIYTGLVKPNLCKTACLERIQKNEDFVK